MSPISRDGSMSCVVFVPIHGSICGNPWIHRPTGPRISPGEPPGPGLQLPSHGVNYRLVTEIADRRQKLNIPFRPSSPNR